MSDPCQSAECSFVNRQSKQGETCHGFANEVIKDVRRRRHDGSRARVAKVALHRKLPRERGSTASAHGLIRDFKRGFGGDRFCAQHPDQGCLTAGFDSRQGLIEKTSRRIQSQAHAREPGADAGIALARLSPRCSRRALLVCCTAEAKAASPMPSETAALPIWNQGRTTSIIILKPCPSSESLKSCPT